MRAPSALLAAAALLGACAAPPAQRAPDEALFAGRLSLQVEGFKLRPAQSIGAAFELQGSGERGELRITSPLGTQLAAARWAPGQALLDTAAGRQVFADLDALSQAALGEVLPLAALPDWLAGRPWPGAVHQASNTGFDQLGWTVDLTRRAEGWIVAHRPAPPAVNLRVRLDGTTP